MNDTKYVKINGLRYAEYGISNGYFVPVIAEKVARIKARPGIALEEVITYSQEGIEEKRNVVTIDKVTGRPGWVVTKVDCFGNVIYDEDGHDNSWIIDDTSFREEYQVDSTIGSNVYRAIDGYQLFVPVLMDMILEHKSGEMKIEAGGWLNITDIDDIYGISERDFTDTYRIIDAEEPQKDLF